MAGGNWEEYAWDENGAEYEVRPYIKSACAGVKIHKNWLFIDDPFAWDHGSAFDYPIVMQVFSGHIRYKDLDIIATRGEKQGIYCCVTVMNRGNVGRKMIGCGVYGYNTVPPYKPEWLGVEKPQIEKARRLALGFEPIIDDYTMDLL